MNHSFSLMAGIISVPPYRPPERERKRAKKMMDINLLNKDQMFVKIRNDFAVTGLPGGAPGASHQAIIVGDNQLINGFEGQAFMAQMYESYQVRGQRHKFRFYFAKTHWENATEPRVNLISMWLMPHWLFIRRFTSKVAYDALTLDQVNKEFKTIPRTSGFKLQTRQITLNASSATPDTFPAGPLPIFDMTMYNSVAKEFAYENPDIIDPDATTTAAFTGTFTDSTTVAPATTVSMCVYGFYVHPNADSDSLSVLVSNAITVDRVTEDYGLLLEPKELAV